MPVSGADASKVGKSAAMHSLGSLSNLPPSATLSPTMRDSVQVNVRDDSSFSFANRTPIFDPPRRSPRGP